MEGGPRPIQEPTMDMFRARLEGQTDPNVVAMLIQPLVYDELGCSITDGHISKSFREMYEYIPEDGKGAKEIIMDHIAEGNVEGAIRYTVHAFRDWLSEEQQKAA